MIDWLRTKALFAGGIICKHYELAEEIYCQFRDDSNDDKIPKTFLEAPTTEQIFTVPSKFKSLSKEVGTLKTEEEVKKIVFELFAGMLLFPFNK